MNEIQYNMLLGFGFYRLFFSGCLCWLRVASITGKFETGKYILLNTFKMHDFCVEYVALHDDVHCMFQQFVLFEQT